MFIRNLSLTPLIRRKPHKEAKQRINWFNSTLTAIETADQYVVKNSEREGFEPSLRY